MLKNQPPYYLLFAFLILLIISNCTGNGSTPTQISPEIEPTSIETIIEPTATLEVAPTQIIKNLHVLLKDVENYLDPGSVDQISSAATELGYLVSISDELPENTDDKSTIIIFTQDEQVLTHINGIAKERLVIVGEEILAQNLEPHLFIQTSKANQIFLAGYFAALITEDWRVGGLFPETRFNNTEASAIFSNGVKYLCGRCNPVYGPIVNFPVTSTLKSAEDTGSTMEAFGEILTSRINSVFIPGEYLYNDLVILLRQNEITIFSDVSLESEIIGWVDYSVTNNLNEIIIDILENNESRSDGNDKLVVEYSILENSEEIPLGRANFLQEMMNNLQSGLISPFELSSDGS